MTALHNDFDGASKCGTLAHRWWERLWCLWGECHYVSIKIDIIHDPIVLFLDEPIFAIWFMLRPPRHHPTSTQTPPHPKPKNVQPRYETQINNNLYLRCKSTIQPFPWTHSILCWSGVIVLGWVCDCGLW